MLKKLHTASDQTVISPAYASLGVIEIVKRKYCVRRSEMSRWLGLLERI